MEPDIYRIYRERRENTPVYWDEQRGLWAVYSYRYCQQVLSHPATLIPQVADGNLGGQALALKRRLVRISNPPAHDLAREMALRVFRGRKPVDVAHLLPQLLPPGTRAEVEWVGKVCTLLPAMYILTGYGFDPRETELILEQLPAVLRIMAPVTDAPGLEAAIDVIYPVVDRRVSACFPGLTRETQDYAVSNLIGLLIQSHDATKGLLSLALMHLVGHGGVESLPSQNLEFYLSFVTEVLRYDSPVHNTRRILAEQIILRDVTVPAGASVLIVVAAGNRDPAIFEQPEEFDRHRRNNLSLLSFGHGIHACIAGMFCTQLTAQAMMYLFNRYNSVRILHPLPEYEPLVNVRMVRELHLQLG
jgi:cytochrome P450